MESGRICLLSGKELDMTEHTSQPASILTVRANKACNWGEVSLLWGKFVLEGMTWYHLYKQRQDYITLYIDERFIEKISRIYISYLLLSYTGLNVLIYIILFFLSLKYLTQSSPTMP